MRTLLKHGLLAASVAAVALACGSGNKSGREPSSQAENNQGSYAASSQTSSSDQSTQGSYGGGTIGGQMSTGQGMNGQGVTGTTGTMGGDTSSGATGDATQSTLGSGGPQKPFYGPGTTNPDQAGSATTNDATMNAKQNTSLSDGEIYAIEDAANTGEIQMAEIARKQATSAQAKNFAAMMLTHHREAENKLKALAKKENLTMKDDDVSNKLKSDVQSMVSDLRTKKGRDFDTTYIDDQVTAHRSVLDIIDNQLLPSAQNPEVKSLVTESRRVVADHLQKAEDIQSKMQSVGSTSTTSGTMKGKSSTSKAKGASNANCDRSKDPDCDGDVHPAKSTKSGSDKSGSDKSSDDSNKGKSGSQGQY